MACELEMVSLALSCQAIKGFESNGLTLAKPHCQPERPPTKPRKGKKCKAKEEAKEGWQGEPAEHTSVTELDWVQANEVYRAEGQIGDSLRGSGLSKWKMEALTEVLERAILVNGCSSICRERN